MLGKRIGKALMMMCIISAFALTGCTAQAPEESSSGSADDSKEEAFQSEEVTDNTASGYSFSGKSFVITLYPEVAPLTCANFQKLVEQGFYDGLTFHRIIEGFMAQGGDPSGTGTGGSEETIKGEFATNGVENRMSHQRGVVSMARSGDPDSASSQFFICFGDCTDLDGNYAAFGQVTEGMEVVDGFLEVPRSIGGDGYMSSPDETIVMEKAEMIDNDENGNPRVKITMK